MCDLETSSKTKAWPALGRSAAGGKYNNNNNNNNNNVNANDGFLQPKRICRNA